MAQRVQSIKRTARGLYTHFNSVHQIPEGGLLVADNVVVDSEGRLEKRPGFRRYGDQLSDTPSTFMDYKNRLIVRDGSTLKYDSDGAGTWASWTGSYTPPDTSNRIRFTEARSALYFTSSAGIYKNDALANNPVLAGVPQALDIEPSLVGTGASWFTPHTQVAYQITWRRKDANDFLIRGAPSYREVVTNPKTAVTLSYAASTVTVTHTSHGYSTGDTVEILDPSDPDFEAGPHTITVSGTNGYFYSVSGTPPASGTANAGKAFNVQLIFTIPEGIVAGDTYEVWRTDLSADASTDPGQRLYEITSKEVTASEITTGTVTLTDTYDPVFLGEEIYTSPYQEGAGQQNRTPPFAKDLTHFDGHVWYANTRREHAIDIQMISIDAPNTSQIQVQYGTTVLTYESRTVEDISQGHWSRVSTEPTLAQNIRATAKSLVRVINRDPNNSIIYAFYTSGVDEGPGKIHIRARNFGVGQFSLIASTTTQGEDFKPVLPTSGTSLASSDGAKKNNVSRSKFEQPEAAPVANEFPVGSEESEILRILPLRESLIVLKEEGIYRVSRETFRVRELDPSARLLCPESAVVLDNSVYCLTTQGVVRITESSVRIISWQIEDQIREILGRSGYKTLVHAAGDESRRHYYLWYPTGAGVDTTLACYVYNYVTQEWTRWRRGAKAAIVLFDNNTLYLAHHKDFYVLERRQHGAPGSGADYQDEDISCDVTASGTATTAKGESVTTVDVTYTYQVTPRRGWYFTQGSVVAKVTGVAALAPTSYRLTFDRFIEGTTTTGGGGSSPTWFGSRWFAARWFPERWFGGESGGGGAPTSTLVGPATLTMGIEALIRWPPEALKNSAVMKQFTYAQIHFEEDTAYHHDVGFASDIVPEETFVEEVVLEELYGWGREAWGSSPWGGSDRWSSTPIRVPVPEEYQRARSLMLSYRSAFAREHFAIIQSTITARPYGERTVAAP